MLAIIEGAPEDYEMVKLIMDRINLNIQKLNYVFSMDIKLLNIILGLMSSSSSYPCPYCYIFHDFKKPAPLRTFGSDR